MSALVPISIIVWISATIVGTIGGFRGKAIVFRNYDDLALVFFAGLSAAFLAGNFLFLGSAPFLLVGGALLFGAITIALLGMVFARTWTDNPSVLWFVIIAIAKLSLSIVFLHSLASLIRPSGKTFVQRSRSRANAVGILIIISPVIEKLVKVHEGFWTPHDILRHRRIRA